MQRPPYPGHYKELEKKNHGKSDCLRITEKSEAKAEKEERCSPDETALAINIIQKKYLLLGRFLWLSQEGILVRM
jgi:hypothetical protein